MANRRMVLSSVLWLASQAVSRHIISFSLFIILARLLSPTDFGAYSLCLSFLLILQSLSSQGVVQAVVQRSNLTEKEASSAYYLNMLANLAILLLVVISGYMLNVLYPQKDESIFWILATLSLTLPITALYEIHQARLVRDFQFRVIAKKAIAAQLIAGLFAVTCALLGGGVWSLVVQQFVTVVAELLIVRFACKWRPSGGMEKIFVIHIMRFGSYLFGARFLTVIHLRLPDVMIGLLSGQLFVGYYRVAANIFDVTTTVFAWPIYGVSLSLFSTKQAQSSEVRRIFLRLSEAVSWLILPPLLTLAVWGSVAVEIILGPKWLVSGWILQVLAIQVVQYAAFYLYEPLLVGLGRPRDAFIIRSWHVGIGLAFLFSAAPFGFEAMIIALAAAPIAAIPVMYRVVSLSIGLQFGSFLYALCRPFLSAIAYIVLAFSLNAQLGLSYGTAGLAFSLVVAYATYCCCFLCFGSRELRVEVHSALRQLRATDNGVPS